MNISQIPRIIIVTNLLRAYKKKTEISDDISQRVVFYCVSVKTKTKKDIVYVIKKYKRVLAEESGLAVAVDPFSEGRLTQTPKSITA